MVLAYLLSGLTAMLSALSYLEFAVDVPISGGAYNYVSITFGEYTAWYVGGG